MRLHEKIGKLHTPVALTERQRQMLELRECRLIDGRCRAGLREVADG